MRQSVAALGMVRRQFGDGVRWLVRWSPRWERYNLVGGHVEAGESFRECVVREIGEELPVSVPADLRVAELPWLHLEFEDWSGGVKEQTAYRVEVFEGWIAGAAVLARLDADPLLRWLSAGEMEAQVAPDGRRVSSMAHRVWRELRRLAAEAGASPDSYSPPGRPSEEPRKG